MIHVSDLANIVTEVVETLPDIRYLLAVDDGKSNLLQIIKVLGGNSASISASFFS
jgi:hypothetical protein